MDHSTLKISYDNDVGSISEDFLVPCLNSCRSYRRTTYSFTSGVFKSWAGSFSRLVSQDIKIEILCDMTQIFETDKQLLESLESTISPEQRLAIIAERQDTIFLDALFFDNDSEKFVERRNILDWMLATGRFELKFAWPKKVKSGRLHVQPLYHKKMGYFTFGDGSKVGFSGSWNETIMGSQSNLEDCSVFSSKTPGDKDRLWDVLNKVNNDWNGNNQKFDVLPVSAESLNVIKKRAFENSSDKHMPSETEHMKPTYSEEISLRDYQYDVLSSWESCGRRGLVKHATGSGKTFTALFAMKRHLREGGVCLVIVPSRLLLQQWNTEIVKIIPTVKNKILNVGTGYSAWRKSLTSFSRASTSASERVIVAIVDSASSDDFLDKFVGGDHIMLVADEVHRLGSLEHGRILSRLQAGARLGLSATPERFMDPEGTQRIFDYFGEILNPIYELQDAIGKALVPYEYFPVQCFLTEDELEQWTELSTVINRECASCNFNGNGELIPSKSLLLKLIARSRIAKQAENKVLIAKKVLSENYHPGEKWLVYCDSTKQMNDIYDSLNSSDISSSFYHSKMHDAEKVQALNSFKTNGGILLSIKCLDEGIDIPSITHALIIASDQNPRQFIQRRGRVLRKDPFNASKTKAYIWDIVLTVSDANSDSNIIKGLCVAELKRSIEFSRYSDNSEISSKKLRDIARRAKITHDDLENSLEDIEELEVEEQ